MPPRDELVEAAAQNSARGWTQFWVPRFSKKPTKGSAGKNDATADIHELEAVLDRDFGGQANLAGLPPPGVLYLDVDTKDEKDGPRDLAVAVGERAEVPGEFLTDPVGWLRGRFPTQRSWSGGWHFLMRYPSGRTPSRKPLGIGTGVECGWANSFYLMLEPSVVREKGAEGEYAWEDDLPYPEDIPNGPSWLLDVLLVSETSGARSSPAQCSGSSSRRAISDAVRALSGLGAPVAADYETWIRVLAGLQSVIDAWGDDAREVVVDLADDWSKQSRDKYRGREDVKNKLASFKRSVGQDRITLGTLNRMARDARAAGIPGWISMPSRWRDVMVDAQSEIDRLDELITSGGFATIFTKENPAPQQVFVLRPAVLAGALNFVHAPPKSSKSNFAFYCLCEALRCNDPIAGVIELGQRPPKRVLVLTEMPEAMAHSFFDLYDPDYELRGSGRLLIASREFKSLLVSPEALRDGVARVVEKSGVDLVLIDTYTAFSAMGSGQSISEAGDAVAMVNALLAIPATVWCCHHDRKAGEGSSSHVHMLGSTAIRAASSANLGIRVVDEQSTVMKAEVEARDPGHLRWLAQRAEALAQGCRPPEPPGVASRSWWLRLGWDNDRGRMVYRAAEADLVPSKAGSNATPRHEHGDVQAAINEALVGAIHRLARAGKPRVVTPKKLTPEVQSVWADSDGRQGRPPGRDLVEAVLEKLPGVEHVAQGEYPGARRAGGYGLRMYLPKPLGGGCDPSTEGER